MPKFIKVNPIEAYSSELYLNKDSINSISKDREGTVIWHSSGYACVKETPVEILKLIAECED